MRHFDINGKHSLYLRHGASRVVSDNRVGFSSVTEDELRQSLADALRQREALDRAIHDTRVLLAGPAIGETES